MKKYILVLLIGLLPSILFFTSCEKDFDEINKDPNAITEVPADYLLPGSVMSISNVENAYMESFAYASDWVQFTASGFWPDPGRYYFEKPRSNMWDYLLTGPLQDLNAMSNQAAQDGNTTLYAVSVIMYSYGFTLLTDAFGPVPFSEALQAEDGLIKPTFDTQEQVYMALLDSLNKANNLLIGKSEIDIQPEYDVVFAGDGLKWQKFCNALRLRMLMRISNVKDVQQELQELIADANSPLPSGNPDNALFIYPGSSPINYFPLYEILSEDATDAGYRMSKTLIDQLGATSDPRMMLYAMPNNEGGYIGMVNGTSSTAANIDQFSRVNTAYGTKTRPGIFITHSEVQFLLAEAAGRQLIPGDPEEYYNEAIRANFANLGLSTEEYQAFISSTGGSYAGLERTLLQKWTSLFGRGFEAWSEYRRTGIPVLTPATNALINEIPKRFLYPISEEQTNNTNLQTAIQSLDHGDALNSSVWWMNQQ